MTKTLVAALVALSLSHLLSVADSDSEPFDKVHARAHDMGETPEGKVYEKRFSEALVKPIQAALQDCTKGTKAPYTVNVVFVIAADGTTQRILPAPDQPVSACVANKLKNLKLPAPPKPNWMVAVNISIKE
jgi:hypothetical protein